RRDSSGERGAITIPWFALCFVLCAAINSLGCLPDGLVGMLRQTATLCLTAAMAALGIDSQLKRIGRAGLKSLVLGGVLFLHLVLTGGLANWLLA
ncbi:MAG: putative sulfate exporter family transporter, partial [Thauera sp.]|nr:putative sulfate exporter family transporter [Thauera sp.]